ncbi:FecR domain-containing protein [Chitinophaga sp. 212800010-3]|uniref:FecR family protein n=1 Tax=unclassified Chitinophaga TaxID=2619133 RepID=UPI002DE377D4|nr:FecR family protein [Chitinophaga sp. 212800010-3]
MTEYNHYIAVLIGKYLDNSLSDEEQAALDEWINAAGNNRDLFTEMTNEQQLIHHLQRFYAHDSNRIARNISEHIPEFAAPPVHRISPFRKWSWAAAALLLLGSGVYFLIAHKQQSPPVLAATPARIMPGSQGAILTLADGREVVLDSMANGPVARQTGAAVVLSGGKLVYDPTGLQSREMQYNKMTTPKGRQFQLTLSDGTRVWLNAASSIRYPAAFGSKERKVEVTGEVYFEVSRSANNPFLVSIGDKAAIEVLGTTFNVNAYDNEHVIRTTLLDGSIKVGAAAGTGIVLHPGQQASIADKKITVADHPDIEKIMAWKNGLFNFDGADLEEVMRQLERWYNIDVVYENGIPDTRFMGEMSRRIALNDLLEILRRTEVDFRIEGRKLIVLNK